MFDQSLLARKFLPSIGYGARVPDPGKTARRSPTGGERQRDAERTRARILEAAKAEFGAKGYAGARVGDIAGAAGVNKQLISYYFGGKEGLYTELAAASMRNSEAINDPSQPLELVVKQFIRLNAADRDAAKLFVRENLADDETPPTAADTAGAEVQRGYVERQVDYIRARQAAGDVPADLDPGHLLLILISAASAPVAFPRVARAMSGQDPASPEFAEAYAEQLARLLRHLGTAS
jgi:AcrR family transcriptional regulator